MTFNLNPYQDTSKAEKTKEPTVFWGEIDGEKKDTLLVKLKKFLKKT